jgi:hypothetical protein
MTDAFASAHQLEPEPEPERVGRPPDAEQALQQEEQERVGRPLRRVDLAELARKGIPAPEIIGDPGLYRRSLHALVGEAETGKTTLLAWWIKDELQAGYPVVFLDEESGEELIVEKLLAVGATADDLERLWYYPFPSRSWDSDDLAALGWVLEVAQPRLLAADSTAAMMAAADRDENKAGDVRTFYQQVLLEPARQHNLAAIVTDHVPKAAAGGRYARGSGDKLNTVDVGYRTELLKPFDRSQSGLVKLTRTKDRRGYLGRDRAYDLRVLVADGAIELGFSEAKTPTAPAGLKPAAAKILEVLRDAKPTALTNRAIGDAVADRFGHGLARETISKLCGQLVEDGLIDQADPGVRGAKYWMVPMGRSRRSALVCRCEVTGGVTGGHTFELTCDVTGLGLVRPGPSQVTGHTCPRIAPLGGVSREWAHSGGRGVWGPPAGSRATATMPPLGRGSGRQHARPQRVGRTTREDRMAERDRQRRRGQGRRASSQHRGLTHWRPFHHGRDDARAWLDAALLLELGQERLVADPMLAPVPTTRHDTRGEPSRSTGGQHDGL